MINLQKILFGFLFFSLIVFLCINNPVFQNKIIDSYINKYSISDNTYLEIDQFSYDFLSGNINSNMHLVKKESIVEPDTIFSFYDLNVKVRLFDFLYSDKLNLDFIEIKNPQFNIKGHSQDTVNFLHDMFNQLENLNNTILVKDLTILNLNSFLNKDFDDTNIYLNNVSIGPSVVNIEHIEFQQQNSFMNCNLSIKDECVQFNIIETYIDSINYQDILLSNISLDGFVTLEPDSTYLNLIINYAGGNSNCIYSATNDTTYYSVNSSGIRLDQVPFDFHNLNSVLNDSTICDFNINFSYPTTEPILFTGSVFSNNGQIKMQAVIDSIVPSSLTELYPSQFEIDLINFNLGKYLNTTNIGRINSNLSFMYDHQRKLFTNLNIKAKSVYLYNYRYKNIVLDAPVIYAKKNQSYDIYFNINDPNLHAKGIFKFNKNIIETSGSMSYLDLNSLNFNINDSLEFLSFDFNANFHSNFLNTLQNQTYKDTFQIAHFELQDLKYTNQLTKSVESFLLSFNSVGECDIRSSIGSAYLHLPKSNKKLNSTYFTLFNNFSPIKISQQTNFSNFSVDFSNASVLSDIFLSDITLGNNLKISYLTNPESNQLYCHIKTPFLHFNNTSFKDLNILIDDNTGVFNIDIGLFNKADKISINNVSWSVLMSDSKNGNYKLDFLSSEFNKNTIQGEIHKKDNSINMMLDANSYINISDKKWNIDPKSMILVQQKDLILKDFSMFNNNQSIVLNGGVHRSSNLSFSFQNFDIQNLNPFITNKSIFIEGVLNGEVSFNPLDFPVLFGDFKVDGFRFNDQDLGVLDLKHYSNQDKDSLYMIGTVFKKGFFRNFLDHVKQPDLYFLAKYPLDGSRNITIDIDMKSFPLGVLDPFIKPIDDLKGQTTGHMHVYGDIQDYKINGSCVSERVFLSIPYLGTAYSIMDKDLAVDFNGNQIVFDRLQLIDTIHNTTANFQGNIRHSSLKDMSYDFSIDADSLFILQTDKNYNEPTYYGNAFLGGQLLINGAANTSNLLINGISKNGSKIMIPLSKAKNVQNNQFIQFSNTDSTAIDSKKSDIQSMFNMNFNLNIDRQSEIQLIFDEEAGDLIKLYGEGDLDLKINKSEDLEIFGDFNIGKGSYLFTLQDVITKNFEIQRGGKIEFNGNPYNAKVNFNLLYTLQASLYPLNPNYSREKKSTVICRMEMLGDLLSPDIQFYIDIPNADQVVETTLAAITNTDQKLLQQFLYLLVTNSFLIEDDPDIDYLENTLTTTGTELLSNQLSNWLSKTTDVVDLGFKWTPGSNDSLSYQQIEFLVSKKFLDDRVIINGNVGTPPEQSESNIIGDVDIEYNLFKDGRLKFKVFNRAEDYDPLSESLGYEQGFGVFFKKQFNSLKELFKKDKPINKTAD